MSVPQKKKKNPFRDTKAYNKIREKHAYFRRYFTHDNGGRPFLVYYRGGHAAIYKRKHFDGEDETYEKEWAYNVLVKEFTYEKVFIGESPLNAMTKFSGGHGKDFKGNSFVFQLTPLEGRSARFLYVGDSVYEWTMKGDVPCHYWSPVGNNDVPYPFLVGKKNVYMMNDHVFVSKGKFDHPDETDLYADFYEMKKNSGKEFVDYEMIQPRLV